MRRFRSAVTVTAAVAAVLGTAGGAVAADSGGSGSAPATGSGTRDGAAALCKRVPRIDARIDGALARLNGPAKKRGSIARLQQRVDNATNSGQTAVETYLKDKLTFRKSLVPTLDQRSTDLNSVRTWCEAQGYGTKAKTK